MSKVIGFIEGGYVMQYLFEGEDFTDWNQRMTARNIGAYELKDKDSVAVNYGYGNQPNIRIERGVKQIDVGLSFYCDEIYEQYGGEIRNISDRKNYRRGY